jgi:hypothetical protein
MLLAFVRSKGISVFSRQEYTVRDQSASSGEPLSLPHFEEERTLLAARPVVPLGEVKRQTLKQRWLAALGIVAAVLLGSLGLTLIAYKQALPTPQATVTETGEPAPDLETQGVLGSASGAASGLARDIPEHQTSAVAGSATSDTKDVPLSDSHRIVKSQAPGISRNIARSARTRGVVKSQEEDLRNDDRALLRAERKQERQLAREAMRERRKKRQQVGDDLMRIREIFEGSPRP